MVMFYNSAQPSSIKATYTQYDQIDMTCKPSKGRAVQANSFRFSGNLKVTKKTNASPITSIPVTPEDMVFMNPFVGAHGIIKNISSIANDRILENISFYGRLVGQKTQAENSLEELTSSSYHTPELKGLQNNVLLGAYTETDGIPFSIKPVIALNRSSADLGQSKFNQMKILMTLGSAIEAFYCSKPEPAEGSADLITALDFTISNLQLSWYEVPEVSVPRVVFRTAYLTTMTVNSFNSNVYITSPTVFDSVSCSFIRQKNRNQIYKDDMLCEYIRGITRVEFTINSESAPLLYAIGSGDSPPYQDIALNYAHSLEALEKNCLMNKLLSETIAFGVGAAFRAEQNSKLAINFQIDTNLTDSVNNVSANPLDIFLYTQGFLEA
tara:strand:+ start:381 stop:1526 length:1146 start_codon:yes stop_codon:yes gene_type:complete